MRFRLLRIQLAMILFGLSVMLIFTMTRNTRASAVSGTPSFPVAVPEPTVHVTIYAPRRSNGSGEGSDDTTPRERRDRPDRDSSSDRQSQASTESSNDSSTTLGSTSTPVYGTPGQRKAALRAQMAANRLAAANAYANNIAALNQKFALLRKLSDRWGFSEMVINGDGTIPLSVVNDIKPNSAMLSASYAFRPNYPDVNGHHYLSLNYLGRGLDVDSTWDFVLNHFAEIFPAERITGSGGPVAEGNEYHLFMGIAPGLDRSNDVSVIGKTKYTFTLYAGEEHTLRGSVTHGIVKDSNGDVWLFEEGAGVKDEDPRLQVFNYDVADIMWARMAANIRARLQ